MARNASRHHGQAPASLIGLEGSESRHSPSLDSCLHALRDDRLLLVLDEHLTIRQVSENALSELDLSRSQLGGLGLGSLLHPTHRQLMEGAPGMPPQRRAQLRRRGGTYGWYAMRHYQQSHGMLLVLSPADALAEAEKELRAARKEVEASERERREFLRHMSHELRTPLNAVLGFARMMEGGVFGTLDHPVYSEYLSLIRSSGEEMLCKINELMEVSALGAMAVPVQEQEVCLSVLLEEACTAVHPLCVQSSVVLEHETPTTPCQLRADPALLGKALWQVLRNALTHSPASGKVQLSASLTPQGALEICVHDHGSGIREGQLRALRQALQDRGSFYSKVEAYRPIGLGLTLAKEYLHLHEGDIDIESAPGQGTRVTLFIPPHRVQTAHAMDASPSQPLDNLRNSAYA